MAIRNADQYQPADADILLLHALGWICSEDDRAQRLIALTGIDPGELRLRAADPAVLSAVGAYLAAHEADVLACAAAVGTTPERLAQAIRQSQAGEEWP